MRREEMECVACNKLATTIYIANEADYHVCDYHLGEMKQANELVDDLAREIYLREWLIPRKRKDEEG